MLKAGRPSQEGPRKAATLSSLGEQKTTRRINFEVPDDEYRRLKVYAAKQGKTIKDIFREHIASLLGARS